MVFITNTALGLIFNITSFLQCYQSANIKHNVNDKQQMKMVKSEEQDWCSNKPEGSYRFPSRWLEERGDWLKDGRPLKADIEAMHEPHSLQ